MHNNEQMHFLQLKLFPILLRKDGYDFLNDQLHDYFHLIKIKIPVPSKYFLPQPRKPQLKHSHKFDDKSQLPQ